MDGNAKAAREQGGGAGGARLIGRDREVLDLKLPPLRDAVKRGAPLERAHVGGNRPKPIAQRP